jgi:hypothetical protein
MGISHTLLHRDGLFEVMARGPGSPGHVTTQTKVLVGLDVLFTAGCVD